jgi:siroheme synthase-like protein
LPRSCDSLNNPKSSTQNRRSETIVLVDLNLRRKTVIVIGEGNELETRVSQFRDAGAKIVAAETRRNGNGRIVIGPIKFADWNDRKAWKKLFEKYDPYALILATPNKALASKIVRSVRNQTEALIYAVDLPKLNDFNMPALAKLGDIRIAVSTGGLSPVMASFLRQKIEHLSPPKRFNK